MRRGFTRIELTVALTGLAVLLMCLAPQFVTTLVYLLLGCLIYPSRVFPSVKPAWDQVGIFVVGVTLLTLLLNTLMRRAVPDWSFVHSVRVVGLTLLVFVAGTAFIGATHQTAWLLTSNEPWYWTSRVSTRMMSANNLKQLAIAAHLHNEARQGLPAGVITDPHGEPLHGWPTLLLPYLEHADTFRAIDLTRPWNDPINEQATRKSIRHYQYPGLEAERVEGRPMICYAANVHVLGGDRPRRLEEFTQWASNVILYGEATANFRPWAYPLHVRDPALGLGHPAGFGSPVGQKLVMVAMLDGSVRNFKIDEDATEFRELGGPRK